MLIHNGYYIQVQQHVFGTTVLLCDQADFDPDSTVAFHTPSHDPLCVAALLRQELDLRGDSEIEALAGQLDAQVG